MTDHSTSQPGTYYDGCRDAIRWYARWKNGEQVVGVMERPLRVVLDEVDQAEQAGLPYGERAP